jgi:nucleoside-diphosphate-sugar epimerase
MKRFLITGGAGFIGSHLTSKLIANNHDVLIVDDLSSGFKNNITKSNRVELIIDKIQGLSQKEIGKIDGIFHLAAQASVPLSIENFFESSENNLLSMLKVFDLTKTLQIPIVYASSSAIYGNLPLGNDIDGKFDILSPYAQDKLTMEHYANMMFNIYKVKSLGLRFFNVYGPKQDPLNPYSGVISIFIDRILKDKTVVINGGHQTRDFIYVLDIVNIMIKSMRLLNKKSLCDNLNVGTGHSVSVDELYKKIKNIIKIDSKIIKKDLPFGDPERSEGTFKKLSRLLKIDTESFTDLKIGLEETIKYFK